MSDANDFSIDCIIDYGHKRREQSFLRRKSFAANPMQGNARFNAGKAYPYFKVTGAMELEC